jgi:competence protein ComEC
MLALLLMPLHLEGLALIPVRWGIEATLWVAYFTAGLPAATMPVPHIAPWGLAVLAFGLAWLGLWVGRGRLFGVPLILIGLLSPLLSRPPDILVSGDARLIAVRIGDGVHLHQGQGGSAFARDAWLHHWGADYATKLPHTGEIAAGAIRCEKNGCTLRPRPDAPAAYLARVAEPIGDCSGIGVIVSPEPARGLCARPWPALVDRFTVWRDGPTAIWLEPEGARVLTDRAHRGARPWVPPPPTPKVRPPPKLPIAPTEAGPGSERRESWHDTVSEE